MKSKRLAAYLIAILCLCSSVRAETAETDPASRCQALLEQIGENLPDRGMSSGGKEGADHQAAIDWIISEIKHAGYRDEQIRCEKQNFLSPWDAEEYSLQNIILTVEGTDPSRQIIVGAHYDGDGIGDNGSGIALLLGVLSTLADQTPACNIRYVFFDGEEAGMLGSCLDASLMTEKEIESTVFMVNIDSVAFGDYCNLYGGTMDECGNIIQTEAYDAACRRAEALGFTVYGTEALDGYFALHGTGPEIRENTLYTNPWTVSNPPPANTYIFSPAAGDVSDHYAYGQLGIPYLYMEASNWFAAGDGGDFAYTSYFETYDTSIGENGMFMNTPYDTMEELNTVFPGRSLSHFRIFAPLLVSLVLDPPGLE